MQAWGKINRGKGKGTYEDSTRSGKEVAVFVEGDGHDTVRVVEGLLHTVSVVDIDIHVEDSIIRIKGKRERIPLVGF